jgi:hypothetical protein
MPSSSRTLESQPHDRQGVRKTLIVVGWGGSHPYYGVLAWSDHLNRWHSPRDRQSSILSQSCSQGPSPFCWCCPRTSPFTVRGLVVNKKRPKHNFGPYDLTRVLVTLWTKDDPIFIPERYRLQFTLIFRACYWTGARIGAFFKGGLRHRIISSLGRLQKGY